jgi:hypothetical protein
MHKNGKSDLDAAKDKVVNLMEVNPYLMWHVLWCLCWYFNFQEWGLGRKSNHFGHVSDNFAHIFINLIPNFGTNGSLGLVNIGHASPSKIVSRLHTTTCLTFDFQECNLGRKSNHDIFVRSQITLPTSSWI